jgi:hypothetical protein
MCVRTTRVSMYALFAQGIYIRVYHIPFFIFTMPRRIKQRRNTPVLAQPGFE